MEYRERPRCRKKILELVAERNCTLEDLAKEKPLRLSDGLKTQLKKMLQEAAAGQSKA